MWGRWRRRTQASIVGLAVCLLIFGAIGAIGRFIPAQDGAVIGSVLLIVFAVAMAFAIALVYRPKKRHPRRKSLGEPVTVGHRTPA